MMTTEKACANAGSNWPMCTGIAEFGVENVPLHRGKVTRKRTDLPHQYCGGCADELVKSTVEASFTMPESFTLPKED